MRARESVLVLTDQHSWESFSSCPSQVGESREPPRACGLGRMCLHTQSLSPVWLFATPMDGSLPGSSVRLQFLQVAGYKSSPNPCSLHSVQLLSCVWLFAIPWTAACQASLPLPIPGAYQDSCPLSRWCHPTVSFSVVPFSSCLQSFPASLSFPVSQFFASGSQRIGVSASASVLPMNIQDWSPLGCTRWISLQSKGLSRVFSNNTIQKHQFFSAQLSL